MGDEVRRCESCNFTKETSRCKHCERDLCESCIDRSTCAHTLTARHEARTENET